VSLVEDDGVVLRKNRRTIGAGPEREVGEVKGMVDDHQLRLAGPLPRLLGEAALDEWAAPSGAALGSHG
jgi:hypothetical protein